MEVFADYLKQIENEEHRNRMEEVLQWVAERFPHLETRIAWNQPMFTDHGTFIVGFSTAKQHLAIAPEAQGIHQFSEEIEKAGYSHTKQLVRIKWNQAIDYSLLERIIAFNISDKTDCFTFWRK
ncbi:iron chaperone [Salsuginibacillus kocurii]|uniref:iron chaperone n=1 Tax=Salsuginibacillus kocurii TaxID=427078 RepID=UPI00037F7273|nr:iron chaperone [Salsuginibacillus kocurii]